MFKERKNFSSIINHLDKKEHIIIAGARQIGKTTILRRIYNLLQLQNNHVYFLNFENLEITDEIDKDIENLFKYIPKPIKNNEIINPDNKIYLLIDEIQYARTCTKLLRYLFDNYNESIKVIATGSSAFYIEDDFIEQLTGRRKVFLLKTLNFEEFLNFRNSSILIEELLKERETPDYESKYKKEIIRLFNEYLIFGGYPSVVVAKDAEDKKFKLLDIRNIYLKKDILEAEIENDRAFYKLINFLASNIGNLLNRNDIGNALNVDYRTVDNYLIILQKFFQIELLKPFYGKLKKELVKMPKVYFSDLGVRNSFLNNFDFFSQRKDKDELLENYLYLRLNEKYKTENIYFWRTSDLHEVDFIIKDSDEISLAFNIKYNSKEFHKASLKKFKEVYPQFKIDLISYTPDEKTNEILRI